MARLTGLEPATPGVTGRYSNQLSYNRPLPAGGALAIPRRGAGSRHRPAGRQARSSRSRRTPWRRPRPRSRREIDRVRRSVANAVRGCRRGGPGSRTGMVGASGAAPRPRVPMPGARCRPPSGSGARRGLGPGRVTGRRIGHSATRPSAAWRASSPPPASGRLRRARRRPGEAHGRHGRPGASGDGLPERRGGVGRPRPSVRAVFAPSGDGVTTCASDAAPIGREPAAAASEPLGTGVERTATSRRPTTA